MFYYFLPPLADDFQLFNVFRYLTFRSGGAVFTSLLLSFLIAPTLIAKLRALQAGGTTIREDVPESHLQKIGTPSMGGLMIVLTTVLSVLLWVKLHNMLIWGALLIFIGFAVVGFIDDIAKLRKKSKGISGRLRLALEAFIALCAFAIIYTELPPEMRLHLALPFFKDILLDLGWFFPIFACFVMVGAGNAVNLTDGLDGLAIGPVMICVGVFALFAYLVGNTVYASYLQLHLVSGAGELAIVASALIGSGLGFLWYNAPPAKVFMGDTGSLALGGILGYIAVAIKHEIVLLIAGGLFVLETLSVIIQVTSFKMTGKRVFAMAPIHHHFEKKGWSEQTIVIRFWIISIILALVSLATIKLR